MTMIILDTIVRFIPIVFIAYTNNIYCVDSVWKG
jgi:hypothetical protein